MASASAIADSWRERGVCQSARTEVGAQRSELHRHIPLGRADTLLLRHLRELVIRASANKTLHLMTAPRGRQVIREFGEGQSWVSLFVRPNCSQCGFSPRRFDLSKPPLESVNAGLHCEAIGITNAPAVPMKRCGPRKNRVRQVLIHMDIVGRTRRRCRRLGSRWQG